MPWGNNNNDSRSGKAAFDYVEGKKVAIERAILDAGTAKPLAESSKTESAAAKVLAGQADVKATDALGKSTTAKTIAETVQGEFNQVVAEAGSNNPEVVNARGSYGTLKQRLDDTTSQLAETAKKSDVQSLVVNKAEIAYVDSNLSMLDTKINSQASGSPKGTFATISALLEAFPTGNTNIYVVSADGNWYYWKDTAWVSGGAYQSTGIADKTITLAKLNNVLAEQIKSVEVLEEDPAQLWNGRMWLLNVPTIFFQEVFTGVEGATWDNLNWRNTITLNSQYLTPESFAGIKQNTGEIRIATTDATKLVTIQKISQTATVKLSEYREVEFELTDYLTDAHASAGFTFAICPTIPPSANLFPQNDWIRFFVGYEAAGRYVLLKQKVGGVASADLYKATVATDAGLKKYRFVFYSQNHYKLDSFNGPDWITLYETTNAGLTFTDGYIVIERNTFGTAGQTLRTSYVDNIKVRD